MKTARAIYANRGLEAWYRRKLQGAVCSMASSMLVHIRAAYNQPTALEHAQDADRSATLARAMIKWGKVWTKKLNGLSSTLSVAFAKRSQRITETAMKASFRDAGLTVKFTATKASREAYKAVAAQQVNLIKSIPQQFLKDVEQQVWSSVMAGSDMATLSRGIKKKYKIANKRAALIARDQNHKAMAVIENVRRMELGLTHAIWKHSGAGKEPRPSHVAASGVKYDLKKGLYLEGKWTYPGMEINCRCTSITVIPGLE